MLKESNRKFVKSLKKQTKLIKSLKKQTKLVKKLKVKSIRVKKTSHIRPLPRKISKRRSYIKKII